MFGFMVTADGGLTTAGYVITVIAGKQTIIIHSYKQIKHYCSLRSQ